MSLMKVLTLSVKNDDETNDYDNDDCSDELDVRYSIRGCKVNVGQHTNPPELPIFGDPFTGIALDLVFPKGQPIFLLNGKRLQLLQPLDRDEENLSHIVFQVSCTIRSSQKRRNIPIIVRVSDVNDNAPRFMNTPYEVTVPEPNGSASMNCTRNLWNF
uniref:Cadherin domain-containing protein n=1 Tax=Glossina pallidipes TaxID=7398 RepID=A0A1B0ACM2_GLOPL